MQLMSLKDTFTSSFGKTSIKRLAKESGFSPLDTLKLNFLICCPGIPFRFIERLYFCVLREQYAYSLFPPEVLRIIAALSPLVELGAGNGYLAWLLQQMNVDVVPFDAYPVEEGRNWFFHTRFGLPAKGALSWRDVKKGTATSLKAYRDRTLLLCWPPRNAMAFEALRSFPGQRLVLVVDCSCCADKAFFRELQCNWTREYASTTGSWPNCHTETLEIYYRTSSSQLDVVPNL